MLEFEGPEDWKRVPIGRLAEEKRDRVGRQNLPVLSVTKHNGLVPATEYFGRAVHSRDTSNYKVLEEGDFAYATIHLDEGSIDYLRREVTEGGAVSPMYTVFRVKSELVESYFLKQLFRSGQGLRAWQRIGKGTVNRRKSIQFKRLEKVRIPLPPLSEQRKIAAILASVDDAITATRKVIEQTKRVKQGLLQTLMTRGIGHTRFKKTEIGEIPETWEACSLGDVLDGIEAGRSPAAIDDPAEGEQWGVLKVSAIGDGRFFQDQNKTLPDGYEIEPSHRVKPGDVLISRANTAELVGAACRVPNAAYQLMLSDKTLRLKPHLKRITPGFLAEIANARSSRRYFASVATGSSASMKNLSQAKIRSLPVALPPLAEQRSMEAVLDSGRRALEAEEVHSTGLKTLKAGLMQDLLTGRVRVPLD